MKQIAALTFVLGLCITPAFAEDDAPEVEEGFSLMEQGARLLLRGLMTEMEPAIDELRGSLDEIGPAIAQLSKEMGPAFAELLGQVDDFRNYDAPELLPNGDIIMRRRPDAPTLVPDDGPDEIEL